eukprot:TRINITY_DN46501_c0_g1_i1.p1 TRINITY_DN46501_c0_g1~~TRINITY_DN46501_c0_g1_i1.p1  ORF type:complete len:135 (+),score=20.66 TRINITY_DN46501_c0_g1_i1:52-456(+)
MAHGLSSSKSLPMLTVDSGFATIPKCYQSHRALSRLSKAAPELFGERTAEKFFPAEYRHGGVRALAYQRRQWLTNQPGARTAEGLVDWEVPNTTSITSIAMPSARDMLSSRSEIRRLGGRMAGADTQQIHKDIR